MKYFILKLQIKRLIITGVPLVCKVRANRNAKTVVRLSFIAVGKGGSKPNIVAAGHN